MLTPFNSLWAIGEYEYESSHSLQNMENKHKKVAALTGTSCSELSTKLIVTVIFFFSFP